MPDEPWIFLSQEEKLDALHVDIGDVQQELVSVRHQLERLTIEIENLVSIIEPPS